MKLVSGTIMIAAIIPILTLLGQSVKDYFTHRQQVTKENRELELASIQANKEAIMSNNQAETAQIQSYLNATSRKFRQGSFYFFMVPFTLSMIAPNYAKVMWENFDAIPYEFKLLFFSIYGVIWGFPSLKNNINKYISDRREYKLEKARINRKAVVDSLRSKWFPKGMNQQQVNDLDGALDAGER